MKAINAVKNIVFWDVLQVALVRTDVSKKCIAFIIGVTGISLLGTTLTVASTSMLLLLVTANVPSMPILVILLMEGICSSETSVLTRTKWCNIPEDGIFHSDIYLASAFDTIPREPALYKLLIFHVPNLIHIPWLRPKNPSKSEVQTFFRMRAF
jgi:hypothetical protein